jgi:hypothetical protein
MVFVVILVATFMSTSSVNPLAVLDTDSLPAKVIVLGLGALFVLSLLQFLLLGAIGGRMGGKVCPGCGLPLLQFAGSHGQPTMCQQCHQWWHSGPACYRKGLEGSGLLSAASHPCPNCREESSRLGRFLKDDLYN